jgi:hypothetical protein
LFPIHETTWCYIPEDRILPHVRHFDTTEIIAESQVALNTLTKHNFQDAFKKWHKCWEECILMEGNWKVASRPNVSF